MASIHQRPGSQFLHAAFRDASGRLVLRSTKTADKRQAMEIALTFERTSRRAATLTEEQARKVVSDLMERVGSGPVRHPGVGDFLDDGNIEAVELPDRPVFAATGLQRDDSTP